MEAESQAGSGAVAAQQALRGGFTHGLDEKQRLIIPSRWRQILGNPKALCVLPNFDSVNKCLILMSEEEYSRRFQGPSSAPLGDADAMQFMADVGEVTDNPSLDSHGRIRLCEWQLEYTGITSHVRLVGAGSFAQLWNAAERKDDPVSRLARLGELSRKYKF